MPKSNPHRWLVSSIMATCLGVSPSAYGQTTEGQWEPFTSITTGQEEIPSDLVDESTEAQGGPCSQCAVRTVRQTEESESSAASFEIYFEDEEPSFCGALELEVLLVDDTTEYVVLEEVVLVSQEVASFELAEDSRWSWKEAVEVWVTLVEEC